MCVSGAADLLLSLVATRWQHILDSKLYSDGKRAGESRGIFEISFQGRGKNVNLAWGAPQQYFAEMRFWQLKGQKTIISNYYKNEKNLTYYLRDLNPSQ